VICDNVWCFVWQCGEFFTFVMQLGSAFNRGKEDHNVAMSEEQEEVLVIDA
jgi:hypothetical protein